MKMIGGSGGADISNAIEPPEMLQMLPSPRNQVNSGPLSSLF